MKCEVALCVHEEGNTRNSGTAACPSNWSQLPNLPEYGEEIPAVSSSVHPAKHRAKQILLCEPAQKTAHCKGLDSILKRKPSSSAQLTARLTEGTSQAGTAHWPANTQTLDTSDLLSPLSSPPKVLRCHLHTSGFGLGEGCFFWWGSDFICLLLRLFLLDIMIFFQNN